jgi:transposase
MTTLATHLSLAALEQRYRGATAAIEKSHFHAIWLVAQGYEVGEVAELLAFSTRWVELLVKRYNEGGPDRLGDQRAKNGTAPTILTDDALAGLKARLARAPDDGGVWTAPKVARWLAQFHGRKRVHDQRG